MSYHRCFGHMVLQLVRVGEQTGTLEKVVGRAADTMERRRLLVVHLLTVLTYPAIVFVAAIGVTVYMLVGVIPQLRIFLAALGRRLPPITQRLLDVSEFVETQGPSIGIGILAALAALTMIYLWPPGRMFLDRLMLRLPVVGRLLRLGATVQFSHGLGVILESGITLVEGLRTVNLLHRNQYVPRQVGEARNAVIRGSGLAGPLGDGFSFMPMLPRMVAVGRDGGHIGRGAVRSRPVS